MALVLSRWFRPLLDLDVSIYLVQNIKLAEVLAIGSTGRAAAEKVIEDALATRPGNPHRSGDRI